MNMSKYFAAMFLLMITVLTITYFVINKNALSQEYQIVLGAFSLINILLLGGLICDFPKSNRWSVVFFIMLIGGFCKALFERSIPGKHLDDFIFTVWKFNDDWPYLVKVIWHVSLDWLVLLIIVGIKNSYKLFEKVDKDPGRAS